MLVVDGETHTPRVELSLRIISCSITFTLLNIVPLFIFVLTLIECAKKKKGKNQTETSVLLGRHSKNQGDAATNKPKDGKAKELASGDKHKKSKDDDKKKDSIIGSKDRDQKKDHKRAKEKAKEGEREQKGHAKKGEGGKSKNEEEKKKEEEKQQEEARRDHQRDEPADYEYPEVKEPTESAKKRREAALEKDKREKIEQGFYQEHSDEDDTLEPIKSLKEEKTDDSQMSTRQSSNAKHRKH